MPGLGRVTVSERRSMGFMARRIMVRPKMARERKEQKRQRAIAVLDRLDAQMPEAKIELDYTTPLELMVAVILSAQCTDKRVNLVTPALFARYHTAADYAAA